MELLEALKSFSACDVSDGLLNFSKVDDGGNFPDFTQRSGPDSTVVGPAYTVLFAPADDPRPEVNYIDNVPEGAVMVMALDMSLQRPIFHNSTITQAIYGGLMAARAQYQGSVGTVVFGRVRDLGEHQELNQPLFSYGVGTCAPKKAVKPVGVNIPLTILFQDETTRVIEPQDVIVADANGIVKIPRKVLESDGERFVTYIKKQIEADTLVMQDIKNGKPAKAAQKERRAILKDYL
ncbi:4-hydroxy-4-methyl-2-oxoglutarate aldolase [Nakaseomyces bracarensis]|uniref:4-hydroxy-4-methyl-2-oxoglutarate aldolase n=1 Tax=Nakaseomyces bracarensis TaxID=273131 RepID=A0ABR4NSE6_9SACH